MLGDNGVHIAMSGVIDDRVLRVVADDFAVFDIHVELGSEFVRLFLKSDVGSGLNLGRIVKWRLIRNFLEPNNEYSPVMWSSEIGGQP